MAFVVVKNFGNKSLSEILNLIQNDRGRVFPHTRGDEPDSAGNPVWHQVVFPTHVGMNREMNTKKFVRFRVPHTRGDEPGKTPFFRNGETYHPWVDTLFHPPRYRGLLS